MTKLENGQLEIGLPLQQPAAAETRARAPSSSRSTTEPRGAQRPTARAAASWGGAGREEREERDRRGRRGRGRGRGREIAWSAPRARAARRTGDSICRRHAASRDGAGGRRRRGRRRHAGERLTRNEAFDLVRRAVETLTTDDEDTTRASDVRQRARELLGRDSESLNDRMFIRILKDAHDGGVIDLRRRGDDFEVARAAEAVPVADQVARAERAAAPPAPSFGTATRASAWVRAASAAAAAADSVRRRPNCSPSASSTSRARRRRVRDRGAVPSQTPLAAAPKRARAETAPAEPRGRVAPEARPSRNANVSGAAERRSRDAAASEPAPAAPAAAKAKRAHGGKDSHRRARAKKTAPKTESRRAAAARRSRAAAPALPRAFYDRPTELVARDLLGAVLECRTREGIATRADRRDRGLPRRARSRLPRRRRSNRAHRSALRRARHRVRVFHLRHVLVLQRRHARRGAPSAVLVRALEPLEGIDLMRERRRLRSPRDTDLTNGPGKLCLALGITGEHNRVPLDEPPLVIRRGVDVPREAVTSRRGSASHALPIGPSAGSSPTVPSCPRRRQRLFGAALTADSRA